MKMPPGSELPELLLLVRGEALNQVGIGWFWFGLVNLVGLVASVGSVGSVGLVGLVCWV